MKLPVQLAATVLAGFIGLSAVAAEPAPASKAQQEIAAAAAQQKYAFVLFWRENNPATQAFTAKVKSAVAARQARVASTYVNVTDPAEKATIDKFAIGRTPLPLVLTIAPNGAITGAYSQELPDDFADEVLVTPGMMVCLKAIQDGRLVLVCLRNDGAAPLPAGVIGFKADPQFSNRTEIIPLNVKDPTEARFIKDMELDPAALQSVAVVFMAPPGVLVGKFPATVTKDELGVKLHAAGKCCNDPNCKHNQKGK